MKVLKFIAASLVLTSPVNVIVAQGKSLRKGKPDDAGKPAGAGKPDNAGKPNGNGKPDNSGNGNGNGNFNGKPDTGSNGKPSDDSVTNPPLTPTLPPTLSPEMQALLQSKWTGYGGNCSAYAEGTENHQFCNDVCEGPACATFPSPEVKGCAACSECLNSPVCPKAPEKGFAGGSDYWACSEYAKENKNMFCFDVHAGLDPEFAGKTACDVCSECASSTSCVSAGTWTAGKGITCARFKSPGFQKRCHEYSDSNGVSACAACEECSSNKMCNLPKVGFVGQKGETCGDYVGKASKYCKDKHTGEDPAFKGMTACEACDECKSERKCNEPKFGFVGYESSTCESYGPGKRNANWCSDKHEGEDASFSGKSACEACPECKSNWKCSMPALGFVGYKGATCADYAEGTRLHENCFKDFHRGPDSAFKGQNACSACSECADSAPCNAQKGFRGWGRKWTCEDYAKGENAKFCRDGHTGDDPSFTGKTACDACVGACANSRACRDEFSGGEGYCEAYQGKEEYCADVFNGPSTSKYAGTTACESCPACASAPVCQNAFYHAGRTCEAYREGGEDWAYCAEDAHTSTAPASASFVGKTACVCSECASNPQCGGSSPPTSPTTSPTTSPPTSPPPTSTPTPPTPSTTSLPTSPPSTSPPTPSTTTSPSTPSLPTTSSPPSTPPSTSAPTSSSPTLSSTETSTSTERQGP